MDFRKLKDFCLIDPKQTVVCGAIQGEIDLVAPSGRFAEAVALGIGNLQAAIQLSLFFQHHPAIDSVLFLGSCGVYPWSEVKEGSFVSPNKVLSLELGTVLGQSKSFDPPEIHLPAWAGLSSGTANAPTSLTLLDTNSQFREVWKDIHFENLELYGIASICQVYQRRCVALLAVTNGVGPEGSLAWQRSWRDLSTSLQTFVLDSL